MLEKFHFKQYKFRIIIGDFDAYFKITCLKMSLHCILGFTLAVTSKVFKIRDVFAAWQWLKEGEEGAGGYETARHRIHP